MASSCCVTWAGTEDFALRRAGAHGVIAAGSVVQVVVGLDAEALSEEIDDLR